MLGKHRNDLLHHFLQGRGRVAFSQIEQHTASPVQKLPGILVCRNRILESRCRIAGNDGIHFRRLLVNAEFHGAHIVFFRNLFERRNPVRSIPFPEKRVQVTA